MSNPNVLNLDAVAPPKRIIAFQGQEYEVKELTLGEFVEITRQSERLERAADGELSESQVAEQTIDSLKRFIPDMPSSVLDSLTFNQVSAITAFVQSSADMVAEAGEKPEASDTPGEAQSK